MKVLFCCATFQELKVVKEEIKNLHLKQHLPFEFFCCGIGNYATIFSLTKFLEEHSEPYFLVNIGVCGYRGEKVSCIQASVIHQIQIQKEQIIPQNFILAPLKHLISSEIPVKNEEEIQDFFSLQEKTLGIDMESAGIEYVAQQFQFPRIFLKVPCDKIGLETEHFDYQQALQNLKTQIDYQRLVDRLLEILKKNEKSDSVLMD